MDEDKKKAAKEADTDDEGEDAAKEEKEEDDDEEELIPVFVEARRLFNHHEVLPNDEVELKWTECQPEPLRTFLVDDMGFNPDRVKPNPEADKKRAAKRKAEKEAEKAKKKKGKGGGKKK
eukprot:scaffold28021_cov101-Skeletonema_marinoi.AAC.2